MKSKAKFMSKISLIASAILLSCVAFTPLHAATETKPATKPAETKPAPSATTQPGQKTFDTPKLGADALIQAAGVYDVAALKAILGPDSADIISSQDPVQDKNRAVAFAGKAKEKTSINMKNPNRAILSVGNDNFELPIPLVRNAGKWSFDTKVGREEILNRRIGANELDTIEVLRGFDEGQTEYASVKHDGSSVNQ